jgi:hypothetical protein
LSLLRSPPKVGPGFAEHRENRKSQLKTGQNRSELIF